MEFTGKLKEDLAKCKTREEVQDKLKEAGIALSDQELDSVAGGSTLGDLLGVTRRRRCAPSTEVI